MIPLSSAFSRENNSRQIASSDEAPLSRSKSSVKTDTPETSHTAAQKNISKAKPEDKTGTIIIECPACRKKYRVRTSNIPKGLTAARCKACGQKIPFETVGSRTDESPETTATDGTQNQTASQEMGVPAPRKQGTEKNKADGGKSSLSGQLSDVPDKPDSETRSDAFSGDRRRPDKKKFVDRSPDSETEDTDSPSSLLTHHGKLSRQKTSSISNPVKAIACIVFLLTAVYLLMPHINQWTAPTVVEPERQAPVKTPFVEREPFAGLKINVPRFVEATEQRIPAEQKNTTYKTVLSIIRESKVEQATVLLFSDENDTAYPVVMIKAADRQQLEKFLSEDGMVSPFVEKIDPNTYKILTQAFDPETVDWQRLNHYQIGLFENGAIIGPLNRIETWRENRVTLPEFPIFQLVEPIEKPQDIFSGVVEIPENFSKNLNNVIHHPAIKKDIKITVVTAIISGFIDRIAESLTHVRSLGVGFGINEANRRNLRYIQKFKNGFDAKAVPDRIKNGVPGDVSMDQMTRSVVEIVKNPHLKTDVHFKNQQLSIEVQWEPEYDEMIVQTLHSAIFGGIISQAFIGDLKPTPGQIASSYIQKPPISQDLDAFRLKQTLPEIIKNSLFTGHYWAAGDQPSMTLELDPIVIPNGHLSKMTYDILEIKSFNHVNLQRDVDPKFTFPIPLNSPYPNHLMLPVKPGTPAASLDYARLRFKVSIPVKVKTHTIRAKQTEDYPKNLSGFIVDVKKLDQDVAHVHCKGKQQVYFYAFDKTGGTLAKKDSSSASSNQSTDYYLRYQGIIDKLEVIVVLESLAFAFDIDVDLNEGRQVQLPEKPTEQVPVRHIRMPVRNFVSVTHDDLDDLQVVWKEAGEGQWSDQLVVKLPKAPMKCRTNWDVYLFGKSEPMETHGQPVLENNRTAFTFEKGKLKNAHAVFGRLRLNVDTAIQRLSFSNEYDQKLLKRSLDSGETIDVRFDKNQVMFSDAGKTILQTTAYDSDGLQLKEGSHAPFRKGRHVRYYWGIPARFVIDVSRQSFDKQLSFEIIKRPVNTQAFDAYREKIQRQWTIVDMLHTIDASRKNTKAALRGDLAGLYYIYDENNRPLKRIDRQIAHSDPKGQKIFGYRTQPWKGYFFSVSSGYQEGKTETDYYRRKKERQFIWKNGTLSEKLMVQPPDLLAIPSSGKEPTYFLRWGKVYSKHLDGVKLSYTPKNTYQTDWIEIR